MSKRIVEIHEVWDFQKVYDFKKNCATDSPFFSRFSSEVYTVGHEIVPALHACREARYHLTHPLCGNGYYEKVPLVTDDLYDGSPPSGENEEGVDDAYAWVNYEVDMIDISDPPYTLPDYIIPIIKRLRYRLPHPGAGCYEIQPKRGEYYFPNVKEADIFCWHDRDGLDRIVKVVGCKPYCVAFFQICNTENLVFRCPRRCCGDD